MPDYVALLRAINVGGRVLKMADLRECLVASGLRDVDTYIQTGNVRFSTSMRSKANVERHVEKGTTRDLRVVTKLAELWAAA